MRLLQKAPAEDQEGGQAGEPGGEGLRSLRCVPGGVVLMLSRVVSVPGTGAGVPGVGIPVQLSFPASLVLMVRDSCGDVWRVSVKTPRKKKSRKKKKRKSRYSGTEMCFDFP